MKLNEISAHDIGEAERMCEQQLSLDRDAVSIPGILMRRPHLGLAANRGSATLGVCIGSAMQDDPDRAEGFVDLIVVERAEQRQVSADS